jgi:hypothetical protein
MISFPSIGAKRLFRPARASAYGVLGLDASVLNVLGLTMDQLIAEKIATYKRHVTLKLGDGIDRSYVPGEWLGRPPFN